METKRALFGVLLLLLIITASSLSREQNRVETISKVIANVQGYLNSQCVYFTETGDSHVNHELLSVQRYLSKECIQSAILNNMTSCFKEKYNYLGDCSSPLYVFIEENALRERLIALSKSKGIAGKNWLVFLNEFQNLDDYFMDINIPFDCEFIVVVPFVSGESLQLIEVYRVAPHFPLETFDFGSWSLTKGFRSPKQSFYERRSNLRGVVFKTSIHKWAPLANIQQDNDGRLQVKGFFGVVWKILESQLNFSSELILPEDGLWGSLLENGTWDGLVGTLVRGDAEMVGVGMTLTPERAASVTFSIPLFVNYQRIYIRQPRHVVSLSGLISPFSAQLWLALLACAGTLSTILALLHKINNQARPSGDIIFQVFSAMFCQQGMAIRPSASSMRIVIFLVYLIGVVIINSYSCFVISSLTTYRPEMPFDSLRTFLQDGTYSLGMMKVGHLYDEFKNAQEYNQKQLKQAFERHIATDPRNTPETDEEGLQRVCEARYAFIAEEGARLMATDLNCVVVSLKKHFEKNLVGYVFPKNSPYVGLINRKILNLMNSGTLKKLFKDSYYRRPILQRFDLRATLGTVAPILSVGVTGIEVSFLLLTCEILRNIIYKKTVGKVHFLGDRKYKKISVTRMEKSLRRTRLRRIKKPNIT